MRAEDLPIGIETGETDMMLLVARTWAQRTTLSECASVTVSGQTPDIQLEVLPQDSRDRTAVQIETSDEVDEPAADNMIC